MPFTVERGFWAVWMVILVVWGIGALFQKRAARKQSSPELIVHVALLFLAVSLLVNRVFRRGILAWRWVPNSPAAGWAGLAITAVGIALAIWARFYLGSNWSSTVTVKQGHELIRGGPYTFVRHPIYSGLALAVLGSAIAVGEVRALLGFMLIVIEFKRKSLLEERFMIDQFGATYLDYRKAVKGLIPFLW